MNCSKMTAAELAPQGKSTRHKKAVCPSCGLACEPGISWPGINYCRAFVLLRFIESEPGLSGADLAHLSGIHFVGATKGLDKLRGHGVVQTEMENRAEGSGFRYRYWAGENIAVRQRFIEAVRRAEALNGL